MHLSTSMISVFLVNLVTLNLMRFFVVSHQLLRDMDIFFCVLPSLKQEQNEP
jgi:hypothetical protein